MAHAEICPICHGSGKLATNTTMATEPCYGCNSKGWVEVSDTVVQSDILGKYHVLPNDESKD